VGCRALRSVVQQGQIGVEEESFQIMVVIPYVLLSDHVWLQVVALINSRVCGQPIHRASAHSQIGYKHAEGREIEEQNDIIDSMVRAWLKDFNLPKTLCFKASQAAIDVKNVSSKSVFR